MLTSISNSAITHYPAMQRSLMPSLASLPTWLPPEIREVIEKQLDVADWQNFFKALATVTRNGEPIDSPALKLHLLQQKVPIDYQCDVARSDKSLQIFALNQLKILWKSGQLDQVVEKPALFDLVRLVGGPVLFRFLQERIEEDAELERKLLNWVERSRTEEVQSIAANALTLLVKAEVDMSEHDFKRIRVPGADLSGGQFDGAKFEGADLRHVNFHRARLRGADLQRADLAGVYFGELPTIDLGSEVIDCFYSPDGRWLVTESYDEIKLYHMETLELRHTFLRYSHLEGDPDSGWDDANAEGEHLGFNNSSDGYMVDYLTFYDESMFFSTDGRVLAFAGRRDGSIKLWRLDGAEEWQILKGHRGGVKSIAFSPEGKFLATGSTDGRVRLWKLGNSEEWHILEGHTNKVVSVQFSPDDKLLASGGRDGILKLWNVESGRVWRTFVAYHQEPPPYNHKIAGVKFSPNGEFLVLGYWYTHSYTVQLWSVKSGEKLNVFTVEGEHKLESVDFSPNNEFLAVFNKQYRNGIGVLWSIKHRKVLKMLKGHTDQVASVKFSSDNRYLASGSQDGTVKLWSTESGEVLRTYGYYKEVRWVNFSLDSKVLMWRVNGKGNSILKLQNIDAQREGSYFGPSKKKLKITNVSVEGARGLSLVNKLLLKQKVSSQ